MTEPLPSDLTFYEPDLSFLVHKSKLDIMTLRTKLQFAQAWQMDAEAVRSCTLELKEAEQTLATLGRRLTEELDRKDFLLSNPSDWKTQSSSVGNKRKVDHIDANALRLKRARKDAPDQEQYEQARNHLDFPDEHEEYFHPTWVCLMNTWSNTCATFTQIWPTLLGTSRWSTSGSFATMACTTMNTMLIKITTCFDTSLSSHSTR